MLDLFFDFRNTCFKTLISLQSPLNELAEDNVMEEDDHTEYHHYEKFKLSDDSERVQDSLNPTSLTQQVLDDELGIDKVVSEEVVFDERDCDTTKERQFQVGCYVSLLEGFEEGEKEGLTLMRRFKCITCKKVFSSYSELDEHWDICEEVIDDEVPTKDLMNVDNINDTEIYEDNETFENGDEKVTPKKNARSKEFCCDTCGQVFKQLWLLTRHIQVKHICVRPYSCPHCPRKFYDKYELKYHQRLHEDVEDFCCNLCGRRFARRSGLRTHMRSHTGEKPYQCQTCEKSFAHVNSLITHERVHTGERPYTCKFCPRTFAQYSTARSHEEMHRGGLRLFQCEVCDRMYKSEKELSAHFLTHGVLDHRCDICNKGFKKLTELKKHNQRFHFDKKPFACSNCSKSYMTSRELQAHSTVHTGELPFTCLFCSKKYRLKSTLRKHMDKHHKGIASDPLDPNTMSLNIF